MCRSTAAASVALFRRKKVYHLRLSARYGRRLPERIRFLRCKSGVGLLRRADTRLRSLQKPMLNKLSGNAYGSPAHTLAPQSLAPLPALHRTSTSPFHKIKPQSEFEARFCLAGCRQAANLEKRKPKCAAETATSFRFVVTHWRFHRTSPCIFRSAQGRFRGFLRRAVGGSWQTASGQSPEPHKRLYNSLFAFSILNKLWVLVSR